MQWRAKARHRHRHLDVPDFSKLRGDMQKNAKLQWLQGEALNAALGIDDENDHRVQVSFKNSGPLGLMVLNCKVRELPQAVVP